VIQPVIDPIFSATVRSDRGALVVVLVGTADFNVKPELDRFVRDVHRLAGEAAAFEVRVELGGLVFIDSSCLKSLAWWVRTVGTGDGREPYRIAFVANPSARWQRRSIGALVAIAGPAVSLIDARAA
jgi:hypothetical protein